MIRKKDTGQCARFYQLVTRTALGCLKVASRDQFSCPGFGPRSHSTPQYLGQLMGFSAYVW
jgi:hypothetical protein